MAKFITVITGASGAVYARRFIEVLNHEGHQQLILISNPARDVLKHELGLELSSSAREQRASLISAWELKSPELISCGDIEHYDSPVASGSGAADALVVIPCTMGSIARFSQGVSLNLIERSFDVMLKEGKKIILVPRETPLSQLHLRNMLELARMGVDIIPAMPAFYHRPEGIMDLVDFIVGRVIEHLGLEHSLYQRLG
jgi:4-hydroxy-3-polyprenylbenzoate decarboxylase